VLLRHGLSDLWVVSGELLCKVASAAAAWSLCTSFGPLRLALVLGWAAIQSYQRCCGMVTLVMSSLVLESVGRVASAAAAWPLCRCNGHNNTYV